MPFGLPQGTKHDDNKNQLDLFSPFVYEAIGEVLTYGAAKYESHNWAKGILYSRVLGALKRHISEFEKGNRYDPEWGLHHLAHAGCCLMFLLHYELFPSQYAMYDNRPNWWKMVVERDPT
jgi:hypothetical protein